MRRAILGVVAAGLLMGVAACSGDEQDAVDVLGMTPEQFLERVQEALTRRDQVAYVEAETTAELKGSWDQLDRTKAWLALPGKARLEGYDNTDKRLHIISGDRMYNRWATGLTNETGTEAGGSCLRLEVDFVIKQVTCGFRLQHFLPAMNPHIEAGAEFKGKRTVALVTEGGSVNPGTNEVEVWVHRLHVDSVTMLPVGTEMESPGRPDRGRIETVFNVSFVPAASLAPGFMEPSAVEAVATLAPR